jgi:hypothetical protein
LIDQRTSIDALFGAGDVLAPGARSRRAGVALPFRDLRGQLDDHEVCRVTDPPLTEPCDPALRHWAALRRNHRAAAIASRQGTRAVHDLGFALQNATSTGKVYAERPRSERLFALGSAMRHGKREAYGWFAMLAPRNAEIRR